jgi:phosphatidylserine/phosphatidylglycerophosphate/cardiolipin synthase-like enzyme
MRHMRLLIALLTLSLSAAHWHVFLSPTGGCTDAVVKQLTAARSNVLVQAYSFTSPPIARALVEAAGRGVRVIRARRASATPPANSLLNKASCR